MKSVYRLSRLGFVVLRPATDLSFIPIFRVRVYLICTCEYTWPSAGAGAGAGAAWAILPAPILQSFFLFSR